MLQNNDYDSRFLIPIAKAVFVFLFLLVMLLATILFYDFSDVNIEALAFFLALVCLVFLSKNVYDLGLSDLKKVKNNNQPIKQPEDYASKKLFFEVFDNSIIAYLVLDSNGNITLANPAASRLLGKNKNHLIGKYFFSCVDTSQTDHLILIKEKFKNGIVISNEEMEIKQARSMAWAILSILQFRDLDKNKLSLVTLLDITKQKEVDIAKSEFVSLASHQLRTPIAGMRWSAELLLMGESDPLTKQQQRYVNRLLSNIQRMGNLVDDFLQVSRFDLGTKTVQPEVVNLPSLLDDIINEQLVIANGRGLTVVRKYDERVTELVTDLNLLRMIITNLYNNAIKYSRSHGSVDVSYVWEGDNIIFDIKDSGIGIPISEQGKIFSKVFRASNAIKEVPDGTGLGLYIVKKAVQVLRGRVTFVSTENIGTTFTVVIPIAV